MPKRIRIEGKTYIVPDDATDEEINQFLAPPVAPSVSLPRGFENFTPAKVEIAGAPPAPARQSLEEDFAKTTGMDFMLSGYPRLPVPKDVEKAGPAFAGSMPAVGATLGSLVGPEGTYLGAYGGSNVETLLKSFDPATFGKGVQTVPELYGKQIRDALMNALFPQAIGAAGSRVATQNIASLPGLRNLPAVREGAARVLSEKIRNQFTRPEAEVFAEGASETARQRALRRYRISESDKFLETSNPNFQAPNYRLDPVATQEYQAARFGPEPPVKPAILPPLKPQLEDFPLPPKPVEMRSTPGLNAQNKKAYEAAVELRNKEYEKALSNWKLDTKDLEKYTSEGYKAEQEAFKASGQNRMGQMMLQLEKDAKAGVDVMKTQNWGEIRRKALSDPTQMHNLKLVAGEGVTESLAFNELLGSKPNEVLNAKAIQARLSDPSEKAMFDKAIGSYSRETFKNLLSALDKHQTGHGFSNSLLKWSKGRLQLGGAGMAIWHPTVGLPVLGASTVVVGTNKFFEVLMRKPEFSRTVTKALTTPMTAPEAPALAEALQVIFRTLNAQLGTKEGKEVEK